MKNFYLQGLLCLIALFGAAGAESHSVRNLETEADHQMSPEALIAGKQEERSLTFTYQKPSFHKPSFPKPAPTPVFFPVVPAPQPAPGSIPLCAFLPNGCSPNPIPQPVPAFPRPAPAFPPPAPTPRIPECLFW